MTLYHQGANYERREHIKDEHVREGLDDIASQIQAIRSQGNFTARGKPVPPSQPTALSVSAAASVFTVRISHSQAPTGIRYRLQYDTSPKFPNPIEIDLGAAQSWRGSLPTAALYFRVASQFPASDLSQWTYFGPRNSPTLVS